MEDDHKNQTLISSSESGDNSSGNAQMELVEGGTFLGFSPPTVKGSIAERRAAKCGFNFHAARINTAGFRTTSPLASPIVRSPCLTIPPGISPTALLDSPIMLPNSQAMPSPTTGTFLFLPLSDEGSVLTSLTPEDGNRGSGAGSSFNFRPHGIPNSLPGFSNQDSSHINIAKGGDAGYQTLNPVQLPIDFGFPAEFSRGHSTKSSEMEVSYADAKRVDNAIINVNGLDLQRCHTDVANGESSLPTEPTQGEDVESHHPVEGQHKGSLHSMGMVRTSEDGYNWRKYGQKQVKGSEYPRSYYKCTHPNCQVKKKVERSLDGQITEIIYKGAHNHAKPQPNRRASLGSSVSPDEMSDMGEGSGTCVKVNSESDWRNHHSGTKDIKHSLNWKADGFERASSPSVVTELSDPISTTQCKLGVVFEMETPELSSTLASHDDEEDGVTQGSVSLGDDADDDESDSKRRKKENHLIESNLASRAVREPRVVVQIESEVDILDDGYRWRKYGQKVVKGNPNPRSYYKCTSAGCLVRKHVERASHNLKFVITTYEGKHNHEVPTARNSNQISAGGNNVTPSTANSQAALALPGNTSITKPETHLQGLQPHFDRKPDFSNEFLRPSFIGNFGNDMKFGSSSICQMKYPQLQNNMPYASVLPDFPISLPLNLPSSGNFPLTGFNFNYPKPMGPVESFLSGQQLKENNDTRFLRPKLEQKDDHIYDTCLPIVDHANASSLSSASSSSVYHQVMGNFSS
ncbi:WRKY family transcription factor [Quillaja saponaria]|uniref:WRKY family transcription factor n=1 Tax=Quillaja saponaria TaxID=32244 RepID=A0AAD7QB52_QUISA|nr:WRKY family transcription factor [Quillaja saponaria]